MGLQKGKTNNPKGRPKGAKNKFTPELKERIRNFIDDNWSIMEKDFKKADHKEKLLFFEKLLKYVIPVMQKNDISFEQLSETQLDEIIKKLTQNEND